MCVLVLAAYLQEDSAGVQREPLELGQAPADVDHAPDHDAHARHQHAQHGLGPDPTQPGIHHGEVPFWSSRIKFLTKNFS